MGACAKISKWLLFIFNILFWIAGGVALGIGIYFRFYEGADDVVEIAGVSFYYAGCYFMITVGSIMFVLGFLGCCGAIKESKCLLTIYFIFLFIIFVAQLGVGIWGLVHRDSIEQDIKNELNKTQLVYDENDAYVNSVIAVEQTFKCCGLVNGCGDWKGGETYGCSCVPVADGSNCQFTATCTNKDGDGATGTYTNNCYDSIHEVIMNNLAIVAGVAIGIGVLEIFGMIFTIVICQNQKKDYSHY